MASIVFATAPKWPRITESDRVLADVLRSRGHEVAPLIWSAPAAADEFDAVLIRSCWDYHLHASAFVAWTDHVARRTPIWNSPSLVRWNLHKKYLLQLMEAGVPIVPTLVVGQGTVDAACFDVLESDRLVVKPAISASAHGLAVVERGNEIRVLADALVQPFLSEIHGGESSAIVIEGSLTHVVLKRPAEGGFLVQHERGGTAEIVEPTDDARQFVATVMKALPELPLYARIDFVVTKRGPLLMEAEVIEPELFLHLSPSAASVFADGIERRLRSDS